MADASAAQNHSASDIDKVAGGHEVADRVESLGHGFAREDVTGEKNTGQDGEEGQLHGFGLSVGFARNQYAQRKRNKDIRQRQERKQKNTAVNGDMEREAHEREDQQQLKKAD